MKRLYSWKPGLADHRDRIFESSASIPLFVDKLGSENPIEDQGQLGSCTGNSSTSVVEIICKVPQLSRLMAYYNGRLLEGTVKQDAGAEIKDVIKAISKYGIAKEQVWPYNVSKFKRKPTIKAYRDAASLIPKIKEYRKVPDLNSLKQSLAMGLPVVFGFSVPEYFESIDFDKNPYLILPSDTDKIVGGHAVAAVGYDDRDPHRKFVWVRNSWGKDWGLDGYFKMDQSWFTDNRMLVDDMWTVLPA